MSRLAAEREDMTPERARRHHARMRRVRFWMCFSPAAIYVALFMLYPYSSIVQFSFWGVESYQIVEVFNLDNYARLFTNSVYRTAILNSLEVAAVVTVFSVLAGYAVGYYLAFIAGRNRNLLFFLIALPLLTSFLLRAYIWKTILGSNGVVNGTLLQLGLVDEPIRYLLYSQISVSLALIYIFIPFVALPVYTALEKIPRSLIEASLDLGGGGWTTFRRVVLPLSMPGVVAGATFTFILSFGDFITPALLGGPDSLMVGRVIVNQFGSAFNWPLGSALALIVLLVVLPLVIIGSMLEKRRNLELA